MDDLHFGILKLAGVMCNQKHNTSHDTNAEDDDDEDMRMEGMHRICTRRCEGSLCIAKWVAARLSWLDWR